MRVINKGDLLEPSANPSIFSGDAIISAVSGDGIEALMDAFGKYLGEDHANGEDVFITSERHRHAIQSANDLILNALPMLSSEEQLDLAALSLRQAWFSLAEILGLGDVEHILDRVFSDFCIGK